MNRDEIEMEIIDISAKICKYLNFQEDVIMRQRALLEKDDFNLNDNNMVEYEKFNELIKGFSLIIDVLKYERDELGDLWNDW